MPRIRQIIERDIALHREGLVEVAERLAPGFGVEDPAQRERQMRIALRRMTQPVGGVRPLVQTAMSFLAAFGTDGVCIARDKEPDLMRGRNYLEEVPLLARALAGEPAYGMAEFQSGGDAESAFAITFVQPVRRDGAVVGAIMGGIPFGRMAGRISRQLQLENSEQRRQGLALWVYFYAGERTFHFGVPPDLHPIVPEASVWRERLGATTTGDAVGTGMVYGREYGWLVQPMPELGEDAGVIVLRGEPVSS